MRRVIALFLLDAADRRLLVRCAFVLGAMRIALAVVPVRELHARASAAHGRHARGGAPRHSPERVEWAIRAAARYVPGATCLPQALAAVYVLSRDGRPARVRIGMTMTDDREVAGHAWVETDEGAVLGGKDLDRFAPLPVVEANGR
jgi:hypothetical protein